MRKIYALLLSLSFMFVLLHSKELTPILADNIKMCVNIVIPTFLFPLLIVEIFISFELYKPLVNCIKNILNNFIPITDNAIFVIFISLICGYPVALKACCTMYKNNTLGNFEFYKLIKICNNPSPAYLLVLVYPLIHTVGCSIFDLIICTYGSSLICFLLLYFCSINNQETDTNIIEKETIKNTPGINTILFSVGQTLYIICINVVIFSTLKYCLYSEVINNKLKSFISMSLEITSGILDYRFHSSKDAIIAVVLIMFGGLSIVFQSICILPNLNSIIEYLKGRLMVCIVSLILSCLFIATK